jgi:predicted DNA-binding antitoxin AbrB/MazE fold protein
MSVIHAIFEGGVFKPTEPVNLPEHSAVEVHVPESAAQPTAMNERHRANKRLSEILSRIYETGQTDTAARHNERPSGQVGLIAHWDRSDQCHDDGARALAGTPVGRDTMQPCAVVACVLCARGWWVFR